MNNLYAASATTMVGKEPQTDTYEPTVFGMNGRIGRLRYLAYSLVTSVCFGLIGGAVTAGLASISPEMAILGIAAFIPYIAYMFILAVRRLNDVRFTGWLSLLLIIPLVNMFVFIGLAIAPGDERANSYGPAPGPNTGFVIAGACIFPLVFVVGILAAIAIPAYQQYLTKAKAAKAVPSQAAPAAPLTRPSLAQ